MFGLGHPNLLRKVKRWLRGRRHKVDVLMLHDLRIRERDTNFCLSQLVEAGQYIVDLTPEGKAGVALLIRRDWEIVERGVRGNGTLAWAKVKVDNRILGFVAVHGPRDRTDRGRLWQWIEEKWEQGEWRAAAQTRQTIADGEITKLESEIKELEEVQAILWRRWSQMRWLKEGEAPSRFFFELLRIKRLKEEIVALDTEDGRRVSAREEVLAELHKYYSELYTQPPVTEETEGKRREVLGGLKNKLTQSQNEKLRVVLTEEEIERTARNLKNEKALGVDGMTAEMVKEIWRFSKQDVVELVLTFWRTGLLS
ncbi:hypothetical protein R1sor_026760 [Riccia sorocarpa]|uniref:Uncharacterized protein n=1 Tax=Riccia sorocarpa TaxID=122646 RepID=A0ABD3GE12_9MARC